MEPTARNRSVSRGLSADRASCGARIPPAVAALALALCACGEAPVERPITRTREVQDGGSLPQIGLSSSERFGLRTTRPAGPATADAGLHWALPPGWVERPTSSMRQANFLAAGDERAECYLTILPGDAGGLAANVNRWRKQMSLEPLGEGAIAALPQGEMFGAPATAVDFEGTWQGMSGTEAGEGWRLVGLLQLAGGEARFFKLVGPKEVVDREADAFRALARSLHAGHGDAAADPHAGVPGAPPLGAQDPHAGVPGAPPLGEAAPTGNTSAGGLSWSAPAGWTRAGERPMREVTFLIGAGPPAECYVSLLGGDGGGVLPNVNRWRKQMGADELSEAELAGLPSVPMCGAQGVVVECRGSFEGMSGETVDDARLIGAVCLLGGRSVFVKLIGPEPVVDAQREAFLGFCRSLSFTR